jgi:NADPH-dependent curcumin reductase CurA
MTTALQGREVALVRYPTGLPTVGDFQMREVQIPVPGEGEVRLRIEWISLDPAMRTWSSGKPGRGAPLPLGSVMRAYGVATVESSRRDDLPVGTRVVGVFGLREWHITDGADIRRVIPSDVEPTRLALGILGHIGLTAYTGMVSIGKVTEGDVVVVTSAAGAVGSIAGQIAKIHGAHVIGIAAGQSKIDLCCNEYDYDVCLDRTSSTLEEDLAAVTSQGVNVFFDNTGGPVHDHVMSRMAMGGRVAISGTIAVDSANPGTGPRHERLILDRALLIQGFLQSRHVSEETDALAQLSVWHSEGRLRLKEDFIDGIENAIEGLERLLVGDHLGKLLVHIHHEGEISV